jgi:hypothetical protein
MDLHSPCGTRQPGRRKIKYAQRVSIYFGVSGILSQARFAFPYRMLFASPATPSLGHRVTTKI